MLVRFVRKHRRRCARDAVHHIVRVDVRLMIGMSTNQNALLCRKIFIDVSKLFLFLFFSKISFTQETFVLFSPNILIFFGFPTIFHFRTLVPKKPQRLPNKSYRYSIGTVESKTNVTNTKASVSPSSFDELLKVFNKKVGLIANETEAAIKLSDGKKHEKIQPHSGELKLSAAKIDDVDVVVPSKEDILTMKDIEIVPLPRGEKLVCTDSSQIANGYMSACINDKKAIVLIVRLNEKITEHCKRSNDGYRPSMDELCLCKFDEDNQWYRAVVSKIIGEDTFELIFIDFGNRTKTSSQSIRKITEEFTHQHCLVNKCYIKGKLIVVCIIKRINVNLNNLRKLLPS